MRSSVETHTHTTQKTHTHTHLSPSPQAVTHWRRRKPLLIAVVGVSGVGKSTALQAYTLRRDPQAYAAPFPHRSLICGMVVVGPAPTSRKSGNLDAVQARLGELEAWLKLPETAAMTHAFLMEGELATRDWLHRLTGMYEVRVLELTVSPDVAAQRRGLRNTRWDRGSRLPLKLKNIAAATAATMARFTSCYLDASANADVVAQLLFKQLDKWVDDADDAHAASKTAKPSTTVATPGPVISEVDSDTDLQDTGASCSCDPVLQVPHKKNNNTHEQTQRTHL
jgi:pimeloyl-ACP methyl ester carboxylesterase